MTTKEAIDALKLEGGLEFSGNPKRMVQFFEGLDVAVAALGKQTAKPLKEKVDNFCGDRTMVCPTCGHGAVVNIMQKEPKLYPYCPWCGQKLKGEQRNEKEQKPQKQQWKEFFDKQFNDPC